MTEVSLEKKHEELEKLMHLRNSSFETKLAVRNLYDNKEFLSYTTDNSESVERMVKALDEAQQHLSAALYEYAYKKNLEYDLGIEDEKDDSKVDVDRAENALEEIEYEQELREGHRFPWQEI